MASQDLSSEPLNGQQLQAAQKAAEAHILKIINGLELRKLAVDQACKLAIAAACSGITVEPIALAQAIHLFLTAEVRPIAPDEA
jgi:hypothetical protein